MVGSQFHGRRSVHVGGPPAHLSRKPRQLLLPTGTQLSAGCDGHVSRVIRLHQQPADHERGVQPGRSPDPGAALGTRDACRWTAQQQAVQRLSRRWTADEVLPEAEHRVGASGPEGRVGFGRCAGCAEPGLSEHRPVQRGMAAALQPGDRRQAHHPYRDHDRGEEFQLLAGDRGVDAPHRSVLPSGGTTRSAEGRARWREIPDSGCGDAGSRQDGVRRDLRALPLQQGAEARDRVGSVRLRGPWLSAMLEQLLGVDQDRRLQEADARHRQRARLPERQLPVHRGAGARDAAANQRMQPAGDQRARRQHLGQLLLAVLQDAAVGRRDHGA